MIFLSIIIGIVLFFVLWGFRLKYLVWRTDKEIDKFFQDENVFSKKKYTGALLTPIGERVFVLRPFTHAKLTKLVRIFMLLDNGATMDEILIRDDFYYILASALITNKQYEDVNKLAAYIKDNIRFNQALRVMRIVMVQNSIKDFIDTYKELKQIGG